MGTAAASGIERAARLVAHLPGVEIAPWYGKPALKVLGKGFAGGGEVEGAMALLCPPQTKQQLVETAPEIFSSRPIIIAAGRGCWCGWTRSTTRRCGTGWRWRGWRRR